MKNLSGGDSRFVMHYILDENGEPKAVDDTNAWGTWFADVSNRIVEKTTIGDLQISTVFLGLNHDWSFQGPPVLWETMIFGLPDEDDEYLERFSSLAEAKAGHLAAVQHARKLAGLTE